MEKMKLYTTGCPKCRILEKKLADKKIEVEKIEDTSKMAELGITSVPVLQCADGKMMAYFDAVKFVNSL